MIHIKNLVGIYINIKQDMFGTLCVSQKKKMKLLKVYLKTEHNYCNRPIYPHYL